MMVFDSFLPPEQPQSGTQRHIVRYLSGKAGQSEIRVN